MATLVLSALGASIGGAVGGSVLGLSSAVIGRAVGATVGRLIDQQILGQGSEAVPTGRIERFHLSGASEGDAVQKVYGRVRVGGQVIWASRFKEEVVTTGGSGKGGGGSRGASSQYSYSVSLAIALGEGVVTRLGRIWADGVQVGKDDFNLRFYPGDENQLPDPKIEAVEGAGEVPAFRGTAYVVFEDLDLGRFGNRVPQFSFEVFRRAQPRDGGSDPAELIKGVALIPGTGEYSLATTPVHYQHGPGVNQSANINSQSGKSDVETSLEDLRGELGECASVSLVVTWFGDDLRCNMCTLAPRVEQVEVDGAEMPWSVSGQGRAGAVPVSRLEDRPIFGGTPADLAVLEGIAAIKDGGQDVMFYPFILMDVPDGNALENPFNGELGQPALPWRGRITLSKVPGQVGSPDQTALAADEVAAFFGAASVGDFSQTPQGVSYSGPEEWSYRRFILHYAHLCAAAGGVASFCIGSELRGLTQIRSGQAAFPFVDGLKALAADVRSILGPDVKIGYAADWSEYFGYHPQDGSGDVLFHLDALWADPNIDFIGIDNYMPLSDWRDDAGHLDAEHGSIYALDYLKGNIAGGEGFDWYYPSETARAHQLRSPIEDGAYDEAWVYRVKDLKSWWGQPHHNRLGGVRQVASTEWLPESKPIWFTEIGCPAIDKGTNQPNVFLDTKSSESQSPYFSSGARDDLIQAQYLRATYGYWAEVGNNPVSSLYGGSMVDMSKAHVWAWDARPWPDFPANLAVWSDGGNYARGHWITGRLGAQALADVVAETCEASFVEAYDTSGLHGSVTGYVVPGLETARGALQPLMTSFAIDVIEQDGTLVFRNRSGRAVAAVGTEDLVWTEEAGSEAAATRAPEAEVAGKLRLRYLRADGSYEMGAAEAVFPDEMARGISTSEVPIVLTATEAQAIAARWLAESRVGREVVSLTLPPSLNAIGAGDVIDLPPALGGGQARIDRVEDVGARKIEGVRVEPTVYEPPDLVEENAAVSAFVPPVPVFPLFLDLPLLTGEETVHAPHIAVTATPWPGSVALYSAPEDAGYTLNQLIERAAVIGVTETPLLRAAPSRWDNGPGLRAKFYGGNLAAADPMAVLNGANVLAIGSGHDDVWEVLQFADAELVAEDTYQLSRLLRGQGGTDGVMPDSWPAGSYVVALTAAVSQVDLAASARDLARHYRVGPAQRGYDDATYLHEIRSFSGVGLRPYAPSHLRALENAGDYSVAWTRRTRIDGDSWGASDVPLGESFERYQLRVLNGEVIVRDVTLGSPGWTYSAAMQAADGVSGSFAIEVAQVSERFGSGLFARIEINE